MYFNTQGVVDFQLYGKVFQKQIFESRQVDVNDSFAKNKRKKKLPEALTWDVRLAIDDAIFFSCWFLQNSWFRLITLNLMLFFELCYIYSAIQSYLSFITWLIEEFFFADKAKARNFFFFFTIFGFQFCNFTNTFFPVPCFFFFNKA